MSKPNVARSNAALAKITPPAGLRNKFTQRRQAAAPASPSRAAAPARGVMATPPSTLRNGLRMATPPKAVVAQAERVAAAPVNEGAPVATTPARSAAARSSAIAPPSGLLNLIAQRSQAHQEQAAESQTPAASSQGGFSGGGLSGGVASGGDDDLMDMGFFEMEEREDDQSSDGGDATDMHFFDDEREDDQRASAFDRPRIMGLDDDSKDAATVDVKGLETLRGRVTRMQKYNDWGRGTLIPETGGASITIVGSGVADLVKGDSVVLHGKHKKHPTFGDQFDAVLSTPDTTSVPALVSHLIKNFKGVGQESANRIVSHYKGANQLDVLRHELIYSPSTLDFQPITGRKAELIDDDTTKQGRINTLLSLQYSTLGIRSDALNRLAKALRIHIEGLGVAGMRSAVHAIELAQKNAEAAKSSSNASSPAAPAPVETVEPKVIEPTAHRLSDEQYAAQVIADYEQQTNRLPSGYEPETIYVQAPAAPLPANTGNDFLDSESWAEQQSEQIKNLPIDEVHAARVILADDPYKWIGKVEGYTFRTADRIARHENIDPNDTRRLRALVAYALEVGCQSQGHTYIDGDFLRYAVKELDGRVQVERAIEESIDSGLIENEDGRFYPKGLLANEKRLSLYIAQRISFPIEPLVGHHADLDMLDDMLDVAQHAVGEKKGIANFTLDATQREAVKGILLSDSSLHVIEGGPGRGKTAIVQVLMETLKRMDRMPETAFCAPVGKAAKVLNSQISEYGNAQTIHSLLGARGTGFEFGVNADNPLAADLAVADEQSMTGLNLGIGLFDAVKLDSHIIMLGDTNQLLPIDCGNVMKSVVALDGTDKYMLTVPHRNQGQILALVDQVNAGQWPRSPQELRDIQKDGDVILHTDPSILDKTNIDDFINRVERATKEYGGAQHVGVICPMRQGNINQPGWNVTYLNQALRDRLNPDCSRRKKAIIGSPYRLNDRVIITKNMRVYEHSAVLDGDLSVEAALGGEGVDEVAEKVRVANGDTGNLRQAVIANVDGTRQAIGFIIDLDDGRTILLGHDEKENMGLAYAITVHAAQGSEYEKVFGVVTPGHPSFMHRALMMTMLSRAKTSLEVFGAGNNCARVAERQPPVRNCAIFERSDELIKHFQGLADNDIETQTEQIKAAADSEGLFDIDEGVFDFPLPVDELSNEEGYEVDAPTFNARRPRM